MVKESERGVDHAHTSSADVKERVELYLYFRFGPTWPVLGLNFSFIFTFGYGVKSNSLIVQVYMLILRVVSTVYGCC